MKYYIIAGEASGDLHGSNLIKEIIKLDPEAIVRGWGGDKMKSAGAEIIKHFKELSFMGFYEVFINLKTILKNIKFCKKDILKFSPDKIIFIDYPGFNLRIAKWAKMNNFNTTITLLLKYGLGMKKELKILKQALTTYTLYFHLRNNTLNKNINLKLIF